MGLALTSGARLLGNQGGAVLDPKKILVVYFSRSGNTRKVAEIISQKLNCENVLIVTRSYSGLTGYTRALIDTLRHRQVTIEPILRNLENYELILIGSPIWASAPAAPVRAFLLQYQPKLKKVGFFVTQAGSRGSQSVFQEMQRLSKKTPIGSFVISDQDLKSSAADQRMEAFIESIVRPALEPSIRKTGSDEPSRDRPKTAS